jgi:Fe-S cluster assembly protein SufD
LTTRSTTFSIASGDGSSVWKTALHAASRLSANVTIADSAFESGGIDLGGRLTRNDFDLLLDEPGAEATLFGLAFARDAQHMDNQIAIDHKAAQTTSRQVFRNIVGDRSRGVFNGKIVVRPGAQKIDAQQSSDNLLLADRAEIDTKPEFEIYADDVKCSHGATIGEIDDDQLFYLQSRGVDEATARSLLTFAFANVIVDRISDSALREHVARYITQQLPDDPGLELVAQ